MLMEMEHLKKHFDDRFDQLNKTLTDHRIQHAQEISELKTQMNFFKSFTSGAAMLVSAIVSGIISFISKN